MRKSDNQHNIEAMLNNVKFAEESAKKTHPIKLVPIYKIYMHGDPRMFLRSAFDYIWFDDDDIIPKQITPNGSYYHYLEKMGVWKNDK